MCALHPKILKCTIDGLFPVKASCSIKSSLIAWVETVKINHKKALLCPVSETRIKRKSYIVQTLCPVSETEEKRH